MAEVLPPPVDTESALKPVAPPPGSPDYVRRNGADVSGATETTPAAATSKPPLVAELSFRDPRSKVVPIDHAFDFDGRTVTEVQIRRLSMVAVDKLVDEGRHGDLYEVFSEMTGLPAPVLRAMDSDDGDRLIAEGKDFLPRVLREAFGLP